MRRLRSRYGRIGRSARAVSGNSEVTAPSLSVLVPTYRRPQDLRRCLEALKTQTRPADEVILVVRDNDEETRAFLERFDFQELRLRAVTVGGAGQVAALDAGLQATSGEIIAITDDDAAPRPHWLARIEAHFAADWRVGG